MKKQNVVAHKNPVTMTQKFAWFDDTEGRSFATKVDRAVMHYVELFKHEPTFCCGNVLDIGAESYNKGEFSTITLVPLSTLERNNFILGVLDGK